MAEITGQDLQEIRKAAGLTTRQLAEKMGIPQSRVSDIERNPSVVSFGRILAYLDAAGAHVEIRPKNPTE